MELDLDPFDVIVAAGLIGDDHLRRAHIAVVLIFDLVLRIQQDGFVVHILDRDLGLLIPVVVQVFILIQFNHRRDWLAQDLHAGGLTGVRVDGEIVVRHLHGVPDPIISGVGAGGDGGAVGAIFVCRKLDLQAVIHRHRLQGARGHQILGGAVISRLRGGGGRGNGADFANRQRDGLAGGRLIVRPLRECDHNVISTGVGGQAVGVGAAAPLRPVGIPELAVQVHTGGCLYIDVYRRQIVLFHRTAVIVQLYRNGLGSGVPFQNRPFQLVLGKFVVLCKGSVVRLAGDGNRNGKANIAHSGLCFIFYGVIGVQG